MHSFLFSSWNGTVIALTLEYLYSLHFCFILKCLAIPLPFLLLCISAFPCLIFNFWRKAVLFGGPLALNGHIDGLLETGQLSQIFELSKIKYICISYIFLRNRIHKFHQILNMVYESKICSKLSMHTNLDKSALRDFFRE